MTLLKESVAKLLDHLNTLFIWVKRCPTARGHLIHRQTDKHANKYADSAACTVTTISKSKSMPMSKKPFTIAEHGATTTENIQFILPQRTLHDNYLLDSLGEDENLPETRKYYRTKII